MSCQLALALALALVSPKESKSLIVSSSESIMSVCEDDALLFVDEGGMRILFV